MPPYKTVVLPWLRVLGERFVLPNWLAITIGPLIFSWRPLDPVELERSDPLAGQIDHFAAVIRGEVEPICSGRDGLQSLRVVEAVVESARTGRPVDLGD